MYLLIGFFVVLGSIANARYISHHDDNSTFFQNPFDKVAGCLMENIVDLINQFSKDAQSFLYFLDPFLAFEIARFKSASTLRWM